MFDDIGAIIANSEKRCKREPPARCGSFTRRAILKKGGKRRLHLRVGFSSNRKTACLTGGGKHGNNANGAGRACA
jgi:hypothetical protein